MTSGNHLLAIDRGRVYRGRGVNHLDLDDCEVYWHGLAFLDNFAAGAESIREFARRAQGSLAHAAAGLKGVYFVVMRDKLNGTCSAFVDNSGLYHAYCAEERVSNSFLGLAGMENLGPQDADAEALVEFLHFGCIYSGKTLLQGIRKIEPGELLHFPARGPLRREAKKTPDIAAPSPEPFEVMLEKLSRAIVMEEVSLDLTGGIDSRLLAVVLDYFGLTFEVATSGVPGSEDLILAESVAALLGRRLQVTHHDSGHENWDGLLEVCDGLFDPAKASRPMQLHRDRAARGITLALSGAGGELFKDFWWLQDFPFYSQWPPNLERLYSFRIASGELQHAYLAGRYRSLSLTYREQLMHALARYMSGSNTQTYDRIYYSFKMQALAGRFLTNGLACVDMYAPYLERDAVRAGYNMGRGERFFCRYHRRIITRYSPNIARVPTTEGGMSASSENSAVARDLRLYVADRWRRLRRKIDRNYSVRRPDQGPDDPRMPANLRRLLEQRRSVERMKDEGILNPALRVGDIQPGYFGPLLALDWLWERLRANQPGSERLAA
jgi:asparagine synthetase B (glutamine-hydrolysing)